MSHLSVRKMPIIRATYVVLREEFEELFKDYTTKSFYITRTPQGTAWYLIPTGEVFTVVENVEARERLLEAIHSRHSDIKKMREIRKGIRNV